MKKTQRYIILLFSFLYPFLLGFSATNEKSVVPKNIRVFSYPKHTELTWNNQQGFTYEIFRKIDKENSFTKCGETDDVYFLDFLDSVLKEGTQITYRIIPKGMSQTSINVEKFEIKTFAAVLSDESLLDMTQRYTTRYFFDFADPTTGMARERNNDTHGNIVTTGGTGFGLMALIAGIERNYFEKEKGVEQINKIVTFLENAERFKGAWAHWYDADTGKPFSFSQYDDGGDLVETAFLVQGLLTAREYFSNTENKNPEIVNKITALWESVDWNWYTQGTDSLYWHWSKNYNWKMNHRIKGFDETLVTYVLAASSPTFPIKKEVYEACFKNSPYYYNGKKYFDIQLDLGMEYGGPLFFTHFSFLGLNPNGLTDDKVNYFERNKAHILIHRAYAMNNPKKHKEFGSNLWGFTSSDDPIVGYSSHHPNTDAENGTIAPTAAISSIVYTPKESLDVLKYLYLVKGKQLFGKYGFYDAYNPNMVEGQQVVKSYLAIDQGAMAVMIENYRSGLLWNLFMKNKEIHQGLTYLGFKFSSN